MKGSVAFGAMTKGEAMGELEDKYMYWHIRVISFLAEGSNWCGIGRAFAFIEDGSIPTILKSTGGMSKPSQVPGTNVVTAISDIIKSRISGTSFIISGVICSLSCRM